MKFFDLNSLNSHGFVPRIPNEIFRDGENFALSTECPWQIGNSREMMRIPAGFVTDLASIPAAASILRIKKLGPHTVAAVVHDYLYWIQKCTRKQADNLMFILMTENNVNAFKKYVIWLAVRAFGCFAWTENAKSKSKGYVKIIPASLFDAAMEAPGWEAFREYLKGKGIKESEPDISLDFAKYGDTRTVP